jgi:hypothetical protein
LNQAALSSQPQVKILGNSSVLNGSSMAIKLVKQSPSNKKVCIFVPSNKKVIRKVYLRAKQFKHKVYEYYKKPELKLAWSYIIACNKERTE